MILDQKIIEKEKKKFNRTASSNELKTKCNFYEIIADPTRLKIIILIKKYKKMCVSDLAEIIGVSISAISHQLSNLEKCNILQSQKVGKIVFYSLSNKKINFNFNI